MGNVRPHENQIPCPAGLLPPQAMRQTRGCPGLSEITTPVSENENILDLKRTLAPMILRMPHAFEMHTVDDLDNDLLEGAQVPSQILVKDIIPGGSQYNDVKVWVPSRFVSFPTRVPKTITRSFMEDEIAKFLHDLTFPLATSMQSRRHRSMKLREQLQMTSALM